MGAIEREQQRFAGELHDGVCQELAGIAFTLDALKRNAPLDAAETLQHTADHVRRLAADVKRLAFGLAPLAIASAGLRGALKLFQQEINDSGACEVTLNLEDGLIKQLPQDVALNLYRIAQEAAMNAIRHGGASRISIHLSEKNLGIEFSVDDNGRGISQSLDGTPGLGMDSMTWRAEWLGSELRVLPNSPCGTRVLVSLNDAREFPRVPVQT